MKNGIVVREQSVAEEGSKITIKYLGSFEQFMNKEQPVPDQAAPPQSPD